jgi:hypothetical protein
LLVVEKRETSIGKRDSPVLKRARRFSKSKTLTHTTETFLERDRFSGEHETDVLPSN